MAGDMIFGILWTQYLSSQSLTKMLNTIFVKRTDSVCKLTLSVQVSMKRG